MPAGKRRRDLIAAEVRAETQVAGLREAADRAGRLLDWLDAARPAEPLADEPVVEAASVPVRRRFWPFGRRIDPQAERKAQILAELEAAVEGRPSAVERAAAKVPAAAPLPLLDRRRAAG